MQTHLSWQYCAIKNAWHFAFELHEIIPFISGKLNLHLLKKLKGKYSISFIKYSISNNLYLEFKSKPFSIEIYLTLKNTHF